MATASRCSSVNPGGRADSLPRVWCSGSRSWVRPNDPARLAVALLGDEAGDWRWSGVRDRRWRRPGCDYGGLLTASEAESRCWLDVLDVLSEDVREASRLHPGRQFARPLVSRALVRNTLRVMESLVAVGGSR
jgi:hypothetical protein